MTVSFVFKDIEILNPFASENEFDAVSPAYYGFSIVETGGGFTAWGRDDEGGKTFVWITENDTAASTYSDAADVLICRYDTETGDTLECSTLADNMAELAAMCAPEESDTGAPPFSRKSENYQIVLTMITYRMKCEILRDIVGGKIPAHEVHSFGSLHDYVDANCYGGFCDDADSQEIYAMLGISRQPDEDMPEAFADFFNDAQNEVNNWIVSGDLTRALALRWGA